MSHTYKVERTFLERMVEALQPDFAAIVCGPADTVVFAAYSEDKNKKPNPDIVEKVLESARPAGEMTLEGTTLAVPYFDGSKAVAGILYIEVYPPRRLKRADLATMQDLQQKIESEHRYSIRKQTLEAKEEAARKVALGHVDIILKVLNPPRASVFAVVDGKLKAIASQESSGKRFPAVESLNPLLIQALMRSGKSDHLADALCTEAAKHLGLPEPAGESRSVACCPLRDSNQEVKGLVFLDSITETHLFNGSELPILERLARSLESELSWVLDGDTGLAVDENELDSPSFQEMYGGGLLSLFAGDTIDARELYSALELAGLEKEPENPESSPAVQEEEPDLSGASTLFPEQTELNESTLPAATQRSAEGSSFSPEDDDEPYEPALFDPDEFDPEESDADYPGPEEPDEVSAEVEVREHPVLPTIDSQEEVEDSLEDLYSLNPEPLFSTEHLSIASTSTNWSEEKADWPEAESETWSEPLATQEPGAQFEPLAGAESDADFEPLATGESETDFEILQAAESQAAFEPLSVTEPETDFKSLAAEEPEVDFEPLATTESETDIEPLERAAVETFDATRAEVGFEPLVAMEPESDFEPLAATEPESDFDPFATRQMEPELEPPATTEPEPTAELELTDSAEALFHDTDDSEHLLEPIVDAPPPAAAYQNPEAEAQDLDREPPDSNERFEEWEESLAQLEVDEQSGEFLSFEEAEDIEYSEEIHHYDDTDPYQDHPLSVDHDDLPEVAPSSAEPVAKESSQSKPSFIKRAWKSLWKFGSDEGTYLTPVTITGEVFVDGKIDNDEPIEVILFFPEQDMRVILQLTGEDTEYFFSGNFSGREPPRVSLRVQKTGYFPAKLPRIRLHETESGFMAELNPIELLSEL